MGFIAWADSLDRRVERDGLIRSREQTAADSAIVAAWYERYPNANTRLGVGQILRELFVAPLLYWTMRIVVAAIVLGALVPRVGAVLPFTVSYGLVGNARRHLRSRRLREMSLELQDIER